MTVEPSEYDTADVIVLPYSTGPVYPSGWQSKEAGVSHLLRIPLRRAGGKHLVARTLFSAKQRRQQLVTGTFFPDASNTGIYDASLLTTVYGTQYFDLPGQVIENKHFRGRVSVRTTGVTFRNCLFTGPPDTALANGILVATSPVQAGLLLEDCTIAPEHTSHTTNCIEGHSMTLRRVNSYHGVDLLSVIAPSGASRADVVVEGSWLHDPVMYNTPVQPDNLTHNDVIQWHGMKGLTVNGSRLEGLCAPGLGVVNDPPVGTWPTSLVSGNPFYPERWATSCVMASPGRAAFDDFVFTNNWLDGTAAGLVLARSDGLFDHCGTITGNRFGYDWRNGADFGVLAKAAQTMTLTGNYRWNKADPWDNSISFNVRKNG